MFHDPTNSPENHQYAINKYRKRVVRLDGFVFGVHKHEGAAYQNNPEGVFLEPGKPGKKGVDHGAKLVKQPAAIKEVDEQSIWGYKSRVLRYEINSSRKIYPSWCRKHFLHQKLCRKIMRRYLGSKINLKRIMNTLSISNISITYANGVTALSNVSLELGNGLFGLLGPNGAGKSTLMRTLATLQTPDAGTIHLNGINVLDQPLEIQKQLGYLPQEFGVYPTLTAKTVLNHFALLKGIKHAKQRKERVHYLLEQTNLYAHRNKKVGGFSGGMKRRLGIAQALLTNPSLIIVDEPTAGLDPTERNRFHNLLSALGEEAIVIFSTHLVDDVKELCTNMAILNEGIVLWSGKPEVAIEEIGGRIYGKHIHRDDLPFYRSNFEVIAELLFRGKPQIIVHAHTHPGHDFEPLEPNLQHVYFSKIHAHQA